MLQALDTHATPLVLLTSVDSTHSLARRIAKEYSSESRTVPRVDFIAWHQSAGLGRLQRNWISPSGQGIYLTCLRPLASESKLELLSLRVGIEVCELINRVLDEPICRLKWPNDLVIRGQKIAGILIDILSRGHHSTSAIVSIGVNVGNDVGSLPAHATSLGLDGDSSSASAADLTADVVASIERVLENAESAQSTLARFGAVSDHVVGDEIRIERRDRVTVGTFEGIAGSGNLILRVAGELIEFDSGRVDFDEELSSIEDCG